MLQQTGAALAAEADLRAGAPKILCDLTQSYSPAGGGGISTYLREKRDYVLRETPHHLLQIVPGPEDRVTVNGRHIFAEVGADPVRGSPNYRFILRTGVVRDLLAQYQPDVIESLCPWVLPWTAIHHRRAFPETTLIAGYRTDFPNAHVYRVGAEKFGDTVARGLRWLSYGYAEITYRDFDWVYTLSEAAREPLARRGIHQTSVLPLGVATTLFNPGRRDPGYRAELGLPAGEGPLLIYAGRIDNEKRADRLVEMFRRLPASLGAAMVMIGDGKLRAPLAAAAADLPIAFTGFEKDRAGLARALASSDIYVSAMADETFGVSVLEAQAAGLPVVGVSGGAMPDRVPGGLGLLGPVDDVAAMARNVEAVWAGDPRGMGRRARDMVVAGFGWDRTFARLLGDIYPAAMAVTADRIARRHANRFASARPSLPAGLVAA
ncbi:glycosyl transferase family 1 [Sphingomonas spermidinifaciens]|uniref:Glycosyl transferase family 1 n=1 Tax=Sphingomonas spermidinifaciens TaxID=1141889 RepID=A0A2A4AZU4_9SPHN|nr:glycosyltransferase [Sphingomonas spermidinifaciens]PCD02463.1 glycosyl transferase family 1 [Sphingomonas spermidinifaciens]